MKPETLREHFNQRPKSDYPYLFGSTVCRAEHFITPAFTYWCTELALYPALHRKLWEMIYIAQTLHELGAIREGARGLGFGVGHEPLSSYFASKKIHVVATDLNPEDAEVSGWADSLQYGEALESLIWPAICNEEVFRAQVKYLYMNMNDTPGDLAGFDFCWSACALEHLGSIDLGLKFIENSLATLRPGGVAVHTTELNLSSDVDTLSEGGTVLFRKSDITALVRLLERQGHKVLPLCFYEGETGIDAYVDAPPYTNDPHLRVRLAQYATTSFGLAVVKAST